MGSGSLRELLILEKIGYGGVYVTDPVVPTHWGPELMAEAPPCVTVDNSEKRVQSYKRQTQIAR